RAGTTRGRRSVDPGLCDARAAHQNRLTVRRTAWSIPPQPRVVLTPGRVAPWNGQLLMPDVARALVDSGWRDIMFVIVGENRQHRSYAQAVIARAQELGWEAMFRITGHCSDLPAP